MACLFGHKWNGCRCEKCGKTRDEFHHYAPVFGACMVICVKCGDRRSIPHTWKGYSCVVCGQKRELSVAVIEQLSAEELADVAKKYDSKYDAEAGIRDAISAKIGALTDQNMLTDIATNGTSWYIRREAVTYLTDQKLLEHFAQRDADIFIRYHAATLLTDQSISQKVYADTAIKMDHSHYQREALSKITDKKLLTHVAKRSNDVETCRLAWDMVKDEPELCAEIKAHRCGKGRHVMETVSDSETNGDTRYIYESKRCILCGRETVREMVDAYHF